MGEIINGPKMVIFWDFENINIPNGTLAGFLKELDVILTDFCQSGGQIINRFCFAKWTNVPDLVQEQLDLNKFQMIQVPSTRKNSVDTKLMVDALELYHHTPYTHFLLISADGDFYSLCSTLKKKGVNIAIAGRWNNFSGDLKSIADEKYFIDSAGHISKYVKKTKVEQIQLLELALKDADLAFSHLKADPQFANVQIFSFKDWVTAYKHLGTYSVNPVMLLEILSLKSLFILFVAKNGYGKSRDMLYFSLPTNPSFISIADCDFIQKLEPIIELKASLTQQPPRLNWDHDILFQPDLLQEGQSLILRFFAENPTLFYLLFSHFWALLKSEFPTAIPDTFFSIEDVPVEFFERITQLLPPDSAITLNADRKSWNKTRIQTVPVTETPDKILPNPQSFSEQYLEHIKTAIITFQNEGLKSVNLSQISHFAAQPFKMIPTAALKQAGFSKFSKALDAAITKFGLKVKIQKTLLQL
jgi:hypothetical protein